MFVFKGLSKQYKCQASPSFTSIETVLKIKSQNSQVNIAMVE